MNRATAWIILAVALIQIIFKGINEHGQDVEEPEEQPEAKQTTEG